MMGKTRCRLHGGKTPKGAHTGPMVHGLYSKSLREEEIQAWDLLTIGDVDDEIRMVKVWLARAFALDDESLQSANSGLVLSEVRQSSRDDETSRDAISRRPDAFNRINILLGRLAQLEKTKAELVAAAQANRDDTTEAARDLIATIRAIERTEFDQTVPAETTDQDEEADNDEC